MDDHDDDHARDAHGDAHDDDHARDAHGDAHDDHDDHGHGEEDAERVTAPMQQFSTAQVGLGAAVAVVGLLVTFGLPLLLV